MNSINVSVRSRSNWNLEVLVFEERGIPEYPEKNLSEQGREPTTINCIYRLMVCRTKTSNL